MSSIFLKKNKKKSKIENAQNFQKYQVYGLDLKLDPNFDPNLILPTLGSDFDFATFFWTGLDDPADRILRIRISKFFFPVRFYKPPPCKTRFYMGGGM